MLFGRPFSACWASHTVARWVCMWTSAIAQCGPIGMKLLYWYMYVAETVFAAPARPDCTPSAAVPPVVYLAGFWVFVSPALRSQPQKLPEPGSFGSLFHTTFS